MSPARTALPAKAASKACIVPIVVSRGAETQPEKRAMLLAKNSFVHCTTIVQLHGIL